jgi:hypothetical protein
MITTEKKLRPTIAAQTITSGALNRCKGKTIADWEFGTTDLGPECHMSERIILHFTDGSRLNVDIGSNAWNVAHDHKGLKPSDIHADFIAMYEN